MTYEEALSFLYSQLPMFSRIGAAAYKPGLETSLKLDNFFGNPHIKFRSIHIGGTNGKGSTSHMLASILQENGYKTALYTSPHLVDFRERMRINGKMIPEEKVIDFVEKWKISGYDSKPSFFELTMMMAFKWFADEKVDIAVIEVGMGGRLDSTNIITPELSIITNISKDHTQFLGDTLEKIANEKAGIIKEQIPVVIGEAGTENIKDIFTSKAKEKNAPLIFAENNALLFGINEDSAIEKVKYLNKEINLPLKGDYQKKNIVTVLSAVDVLRKNGFNLDPDKIKTGIENVAANTGLKGRWTILSENPCVICDTGHNIAGMNYNMTQLNRLIEEKKAGRLHIVIGFVADKDIDDIMKLLPKKAEYYVTNANIPRALPSSELIKKFRGKGFMSKEFPNVKTAYQAALSNAGINDIVFVGGSTFIVADLLAFLKLPE